MLISFLLVGCQTSKVQSDTSEETTTTIIEEETEECINDADQFSQEVWGNALSPVCYSCHNAQGAANSSDLVLVSNAQPGYLQTNREILSYVASLTIDGTSLILRKPLGMDNHGGGAVISEDSAAYAALSEFVLRLDNPIEECAGEEILETETQLLLASPTDSLRKISMFLVGELPSLDHLHQVQNGGEDALARVVAELLAGTNVGYKHNTEERASDRLVQIWNDQLLTDKYKSGQKAIQITDYDRFPNLYWYQSVAQDQNTVRSRINDAIAREPIELMRYVFLENKSWSEILTADYTLVNAWSATSYGVGTITPSLDDESSDIFYPVVLEDQPTVGILSTTAFLNRHPTTATNRNRHRSKVVFEYFLNTNILALADRPIDANNSAVHNPTLNDPQCNVCHSVMEPVAGAFQNWDDEGHYNPPSEGWYPEMFPPGFEDEAISLPESNNALHWLATRIVEDPRFARASVNTLFTGITGFPILREYELQSDSTEYEAWKRQDEFLSTLTDEFIASGLNIKTPIQAILLSSYFRANAHNDASEAELLFAGTARLLTPEELDRKISATTGITWGTNLLERYRLLYGGIDSDDVTSRLTEPNGVMAAVGVRMANDVSCRATALDFVLPMEQRRLFPFVESSYEPYTDNGFDVPQAQEAIKTNIQHLFARLLGENLALDNPEIEETYQLWLELHQTGRDLIAAGEENTYLQWSCRGRVNPETGESLPNDMVVSNDARYTIRAWRGIISYLLADYRFLVE